MKMTIDMPLVSQCEISECTYNTESQCHARAITIGDGENPHCDTLFCNSSHIQHTGIRAGVGACKVSNCNFNDDMECTAEKINVGMAGDAVMCMTYSGS